MTLPAHAPTPATRKQAQQAAGFGLPQDQIGALLGISDVTLRKCYPDELALGRAMASAAVGESLFRRAISGDDTTAAIWWSKCQMRWSPPPALVEVSGLISISAALESATARIGMDAIDGECVEIAE
jgi:hypothetical protein